MQIRRRVAPDRDLPAAVGSSAALPGVLPDALPDDLPPLLKRVYAHRGLGAADLDLSLDQLLPWHQLGQVERAASLLADTLADGGRITIVGDYDADGATSTALAVSTLASLGGVVDYFVPDRFRYGYGLSPPIVEALIERQPSLLVTVDNGISSVAGVQAAHAAGMKVLITDHHLAPDELPAADVIVNPNVSGDAFPSKALAGVGTIFYVLLALRQELRNRDWFIERPEPNMAEGLDLVALGTVADLVPLDRNNRILVRQGLRRIRSGRSRPGICALLAVANRNVSNLTASDLGFAVAPRLNAAGRLTDMSVGIACLLSDDAQQAAALAAELDGLNRQRRAIQDDMQAEATAMLAKLEAAAADLPVGLCLHDDGWHEGVVGLLASRVKEHFNRPVFAFAPSSEDTTLLKGSGRSVRGYHIRDALDRIATRNPGMIERFGGHAMAAGLSLPVAALAGFRDAFAADAAAQVPEEALLGILESDGELEPAELTLESANLLRDAGPWGQGCPDCLFDGIFEVGEARIVGGAHIKMTLRSGAREIDAIAFNRTDLPSGGVHLRAAYRLDVNEFRGRVTPQLIIEDFELAGDSN